MKKLLFATSVIVVGVMSSFAGTIGESLTGFPTANGTDCKWTTETEATLTVPAGVEHALDTAESDLLGAAKIVKAGDGTLYTTNKALWSYTGQIKVGAGIWVMRHGFTNNDWLSDVGSGHRDTAKPLTVADGATLYVHVEDAGGDHLDRHYFHNAYLNISGPGFNGQGALRVAAHKADGSTYALGAFMNHLALSADATIQLDTGVSCDSTADEMTLNSHTLTIRFPKANTQANLGYCAIKKGGLVVDSAYSTSYVNLYGAWDANHVNSPSYITKGDSGNTALSWAQTGATSPFVNYFTFDNDYTGNNMTTPVVVPTTGLRISAAAAYCKEVVGDNIGAFRDPWTDLDHNRFSGELRVNGPLWIYADSNSGTRYSILNAVGKMTGEGDVQVGNATAANQTGWLRLFNAENDFTGKITVSAPAYTTHSVETARSLTGLETRDTAVPAANTVVIRNADYYALPSVAGNTVELGNVEISGQCILTGSVMNATSLTLAADAGTVSFTGFLRTPSLTIKGGTLKANYAQTVLTTSPGLNVAYYDISGEDAKSKLTLANTPPDVIFDRGETKHGHSTFFTDANGPGLAFYRADSGTAKQQPHKSLTMTFNDGTREDSLVKLSTMEKTDWLGASDADGQYRAYALEGYLWNRSETNETWYFMGTWNHDAYMWIDDMETNDYLFKFPGLDTWATFKTRSENAKKELTPGAHKFRLVFYNTSKGLSWGQKQDGVKDASRPWWDALGLSYCVGWNPLATVPHSEAYPEYGVYTDYYAHYTPMLDFADGKLYTRVADDCADFTLETDTLTMAAGATLDLTSLEGASTVRHFVGDGRVLGGHLKDVETVTISGADMAVRTGAVCGLVSTGKLTFREGAKIVLDTAQGMRVGSKGVTVVSAAEIEGPETLTLEVTGEKQTFALRKAADGRSYQVYSTAGMVILFR